MISVISHRIEWIVILEEIEKIFSSHTVFANKLEFIVNNNEKKNSHQICLMSSVSVVIVIHCKRIGHNYRLSKLTVIC